jgi:hypothetical protein
MDAGVAAGAERDEHVGLAAAGDAVMDVKPERTGTGGRGRRTHPAAKAVAGEDGFAVASEVQAGTGAGAVAAVAEAGGGGSCPAAGAEEGLLAELAEGAAAESAAGDGGCRAALKTRKVTLLFSNSFLSLTASSRPLNPGMLYLNTERTERWISSGI